jgi:hypothetical protein
METKAKEELIVQCLARLGVSNIVSMDHIDPFRTRVTLEYLESGFSMIHTIVITDGVESSGRQNLWSRLPRKVQEIRKYQSNLGTEPVASDPNRETYGRVFTSSYS